MKKHKLLISISKTCVLVAIALQVHQAQSAPNFDFFGKNSDAIRDGDCYGRIYYNLENGKDVGTLLYRQAIVASKFYDPIIKKSLEIVDQCESKFSSSSRPKLRQIESCLKTGMGGGSIGDFAYEFHSIRAGMLELQKRGIEEKDNSIRLLACMNLK